MTAAATAREKLKARQLKRAVYFEKLRSRPSSVSKPAPKPKAGLLSAEEWAEELGSALLIAVTPEKERVISRFSQYGITAGEAEHRLASQGGVCPICERAISFEPNAKLKAVVDHDHAVAAKDRVVFVRGILCGPCNLAEGIYGSSVERHLRGAAYLIRAQARASSRSETLTAGHLLALMILEAEQ